MTIKERALDLIGLERMSNREVLLEDLAALDSEQMYRMIADNRLTRVIDDLHCEDCHRMHGGKCPKPDSDDCVITSEEWLELPCERARLIEVGA